MFERDYIMRLILQLVAAMRRSMEKAGKENNPKVAAEQLEVSIGEVTEIDGEVLLSLAPESMANIIQVSGTDPRVVEYIARSLLLEAEYLREAGDTEKALIREEQAIALGEAFEIEVSVEKLTEEEWEEFFSQIEGEQ